MRFSPDILVLRGLADTLLIGPRAAFGEGARHALDSDEEIRRRLKQMLSDPGDAALLRSFWMRWRIGGDGIAYANNRMLVDRVAAAARCGRLAVLVAPNADLKYVERPDPQRAHQKLAGFTPRAALAPGAASSRTGRPAPVHHPGRFVAMATQRLAPVSVGRTAASPGLAQALRVDAMSLEERIAEVLHRTLPRLPADMRGEFEALLDPAAIGMTVAVLAVWAGSHVFGVGFVVDAVLLGAGLFFMGQAIMEAVETIRLFLARVLHAKTEDDLDAAAALLALAIAAIGVRTFVNAITRGAGRVAGGGKTRGKLPRRDHAPAKPSPKPQPKPPAEKPPPASKETSIGSGEPGIGLRPAEKPSASEQKLLPPGPSEAQKLLSPGPSEGKKSPKSKLSPAEKAARKAQRDESARHLRAARRLLKENRADLPPAERAQVLRGFEAEGFRVRTVTEPEKRYRYFDDGAAKLSGAWSTPERLNTQQDRISKLALPNNSATREAEVILQPGAVVFEGKVAAQPKHGLNGGGQQTFQVTGPRSQITEVQSGR